MVDVVKILGELIKKVEEREQAIPRESNSISATIKFTGKELAEMGKEFQKTFEATGSVARVFKTIENGTTSYEIRYRRNGYNISVSAFDLKETKQKFIESTRTKNIKIGA